MIILVDSRQKKGKHDRKHNYLKMQGHTLLTCKLPYGDYINASEIDDGLLLEIELLDFQYSKGEKPPVKRITAVSNELLKLKPLSIDTKQDLQEVYGNVISKHNTFHNECVLGGAQLLVLVEQEGVKSLSDVQHWKNPRLLNWYKIHNAQKAGKMLHIKLPKSPPVSSANLAKSMQTMSDNYGVTWQFCDKSETGKRIVEILGGAANG